MRAGQLLAGIGTSQASLQQPLSGLCPPICVGSVLYGSLSPSASLGLPVFAIWASVSSQVATEWASRTPGRGAPLSPAEGS